MNQEMMQAAICSAYGTPETVLSLQNIPKPKPKAGEVLIKVMASTVNSGDVRMRGLKVKGLMKLIMQLVLGFRKPRKAVLGVTFSGILTEVGNQVTNFSVGDKVFGLTGFRFGAHATYLCLPAKATMTTMPPEMSFETAAALPFGAHTAIHFLQQAGIQNRPNQEVLIYGATGAVGIAAVQIAQHYQAKVTAVCSPQGSQLLQQLNVHAILNYQNNAFLQTKQKFDIIFDAVGKTTKKTCQSLLDNKGKFMTVGGLAMAKETIAQLQLVSKLYSAGKYQAFIDKTFTLSEIQQAHAYVDTERKKGNVVIKIGT